MYPKIYQLVYQKIIFQMMIRIKHQRTVGEVMPAGGDAAVRAEEAGRAPEAAAGASEAATTSPVSVSG